MYVQVSAHFFEWVVLCVVELYELSVFFGRLRSRHLHCLQIFLPSHRLSFRSVYSLSFFAVQKLLSLIRSHLQNGVSNSSCWQAFHERDKARRAYCGIERLRKQKWETQIPIHYTNVDWIQKPSKHWWRGGGGISQPECKCNTKEHG